MLTPSVNLVQSAFPEEKQGEISGLSRSISNLGSSLGTAIAGTILVSDLVSGNRSYVLAMVVLVVLALVGLAAAIFLPSGGEPEAGGEAHPNGVMTGAARALSVAGEAQPGVPRRAPALGGARIRGRVRRGEGAVAPGERAGCGADPRANGR